jgi:hypothetical protein
MRMPLFAPGRWSRMRRPARAQALVEFAFTALFLFGVLVGIIDGARWISTYFILSNAAAEGARAGAFVPRNPEWSLAEIDENARIAARSVLPPWVVLTDEQITICRARSIDATCSPPGLTGATGFEIFTGDDVIVTVTYTFQWVPFAEGWLGQIDHDMEMTHRELID